MGTTNFERMFIMNQYTYTKQWAEKIAKQYGGTVHIQKYDSILVVVPRETTIKQILMDQGCTVRVRGDHYRNNDKTRYMKIFVDRGSSDRIMIYPFDARDYSEASIETTHHTFAGSNVARIKDKYPEIDVVVDESVFETLNKINDNNSLSEKYNVKNVKELKKLQEDYSTWEPDDYDDYAYNIGTREGNTIYDVDYDIDFDDSRHSTWNDVRKDLVELIPSHAEWFENQGFFEEFPFEVWLSKRDKIRPIWVVSVHSVDEAKALANDIQAGKYQ